MSLTEKHASTKGHDDASHGHDHDLAHHFDNVEQQHDAGNLGMWMFLTTEVLFFGGLIQAYKTVTRTFFFLSRVLFNLSTKSSAIALGTATNAQSCFNSMFPS